MTTTAHLAHLMLPGAGWQPRHVVLFSGHMVDAPNRKEPRFPSEKVPAAGARIAAALDELGAGPQDLAFSQAAAGGDLLFLEACQERQMRCRVLLPFPEQEFIDRSITPVADGDGWRARFLAMKQQLGEADALQIMPEQLGPLPEGVDPYERCNHWLLDSALAYGTDKVRLVCLWDGAEGDGPGGTEHMYNEVKERDGRTEWIDTRTL